MQVLNVLGKLSPRRPVILHELQLQLRNLLLRFCLSKPAGEKRWSSVKFLLHSCHLNVGNLGHADDCWYVACKNMPCSIYMHLPGWLALDRPSADMLLCHGWCFFRAVCGAAGGNLDVTMISNMAVLARVPSVSIILFIIRAIVSSKV